MVLSWIDWVIMAFFIMASVAIGFYAKNKANEGLQGFFLGGRNLPWYLAGISMVATTFAADTPLAVSELVARNGISGNWLWWSFLAGGMLTTFFFARLWRRANIVTELEFIAIRYDGPAANWLRNIKAVYLGIFMNSMVIGWVNLALNTLLMQFFGISSVQVWFYTGAAMVLAASYSAVGGLLGVALADALQFCIAMIGTIALSFLVVTSEEVGGISGLKETLPPSYFNFFPSLSSGDDIGTTLTLSVGAFFSFAFVQWWASWYPGAEPGGGGYIAQRMMSAKNENGALKATLLFQLAHYCLRPWPWILVGLAAVALYQPDFASIHFDEFKQVEVWKADGVSLEEAQSRLASEIDANPELNKQLSFYYSPRTGYIQTMVDFLPVGLKGLLLVAFFSAYLSTISTQLNMGASFIVNDLILPNRTKDPTRNQVVSWSRVTTILLMIVGLAITTQLTSISGVWEFIMEAGAGLGMVLILRWYWWRINAWSEIVALLAPFVGYSISHFVLAPYLGDSFVNQKGTFLFTVVFTTVCWLLATVLTPAVSDHQLQSFVNRVKPMGMWGRFSKSTNSILPLLSAWGGGILLGYGALILIGKLLLQEWFEAGAAFFVSSIGFYLIRKWFIEDGETT